MLAVWKSNVLPLEFNSKCEDKHFPPTTGIRIGRSTRKSSKLSMNFLQTNANVNLAGRWLAVRLLQQPECCTPKPGASRLHSSPFVICRDFILLEELCHLLHVQNTVSAAKHSGTQFLLKDSQTMHKHSQCCISPQSASLGVRIQAESILTTSRLEKMYYDNTLAQTFLLELVTCICTTFKWQSSFL